jgi:predicted ABC-type transport system involved in lysophospholipase L1 biosynthesis ATPase subunit
MLTSLHAEQGLTLVMITHDTNIAHHCQRIINIKDGQIVKEEIV